MSMVALRKDRLLHKIFEYLFDLFCDIYGVLLLSERCRVSHRGQGDCGGSGRRGATGHLGRATPLLPRSPPELTSGATHIASVSSYLKSPPLHN